jgi:hypothetical protein
MALLIDNDNNSISSQNSNIVSISGTLNVSTLTISGFNLYSPGSSGQLALTTDVVNLSGVLQAQITRNNISTGYLASVTGGFSLTTSLQTSAGNLFALTASSSANALAQASSYTNTVSGNLSSAISGAVAQLGSYATVSSVQITAGNLQNQITNNNISIGYLASVTGGFALVTSLQTTAGNLFGLTASSSANALAQASSYTNTVSGSISSAISGVSSQLANYALTSSLQASAGNLQAQVTSNNISIGYLASVTGSFITPSYVAALTGQLALDSTVVHDTGNETIAGIKSFVNNVNIVNSDLSGNGNIFIDNLYSSGVMVISGGDVITGNAMLVYGSLNPLNLVSELRDDFVAGGTSSNLGWLSVVSGTAAATQSSNVFGFTSGEKALGVWQLTTGTTNTGRANINLGTNGILFGYADMSQRWRVAIDALSNSTNRYVVRIGFLDQSTNTDTNNGIYFEYDEGTAGNFWRVCTANNGARTKTTTSVTTQASSFDRLWIYVKPDASLARFFINETEVNSISTNIPSISGRFTGVGATISKTIGTAARNFYIDYFYLRFIGTRT